MPIQTQTFTAILEQSATAVQGAARVLVDFTVGSICRAIMEANSAIIMWLQGLILQVAALARAQTCNGSDLDSWMGDFGFARLPAIAAIGQVTFSRFTATAQAVVPVGVLVQTGDGSCKYAVVLDTSNPAYNAGLGGYVIVPGVNSVTVPVQAEIPGAGGNGAAGAINTLGQTVVYVDTVTNASPLITGSDAEGDGAFRVRFVAYLGSLSKATKNAVEYTIRSLGIVTSYSLTENQQYNGALLMGYFYIVADDGTGTPSASFLTTVYSAIDAIRPITGTFAVFAPSVVTANVGMACTTAIGYDHVSVVNTVKEAIQNYINGLGVGVSLPCSRLNQVAYDASSGVTNVSLVTLNGGTADIAITNQQIVRAGALDVV